MATTLEQLKAWFSAERKPKQAHFWALLDSFFHKDEKIPAASIVGLPARLPAAGGDADTLAGRLPGDFASSEALNTARAEIKALRGGGIITHDSLAKASEAIDALLAIVESDDTDLDTVREIVAFIQNNRDVIDTVATNKLDKSTFNAFVEQLASLTQPALVSGTNIKTINGQSILGGGNIEVGNAGDMVFLF